MSESDKSSVKTKGVSGVKDWHSSKHIRKRASHLLEHPDEEIPSDVTFLVGDGENEPRKMFKCHKLILAMVSAMFQAMFYGSLPETEEIIKIPDVTPAAFQQMLRYAYGESIGLDSMEDALDTLYCAKKYLITKLARTCRDHIQFQLVVLDGDPCVVVQRGPQMDEEDLATLALAEIGRSARWTITGDAFLRLSFDCLKRILDYPHLDVKETTIYRGVCRWVKHNVGTLQGSALRDAFGLLLYSIRFPLFSAAELADGPLADGVLTDGELTGLFRYLFAKVKSPVPFLTTPRTSLKSRPMLRFELVTVPDTVKVAECGSNILFLITHPYFAPDCCAFLEELLDGNLHIRIASFDNEHVGKTMPLPATVPGERSVLSHSAPGACWFEWDLKDGTACNVRIGIARKPHQYHSAVFGFISDCDEDGAWMPFNSWDDKRIQGIQGISDFS